MTKATTFSERVLGWYDQHGRHNLPWQADISAYRVWVSEIMLQQTQVKTVIPYFNKFMSVFPTVDALASAPQDEVLHLWTGLGYYARARNLHSAARRIVDEFGGVFPNTVEGLCELPGIGRSTAGAIVSIAGGRRAAILDGNVKRVLARYHAVEGWPGTTAVHKALWDIAEHHTPTSRFAEYTQAIMDLGATLCTRAAPDCDRCPLAADCEARTAGEPTRYPGKKPRKTLPVRASTFLMVRSSNAEVLLEKRPPQGIWGGLWCFPELPAGEEAEDWCRDNCQIQVTGVELLTGFRHTFSHYHLDISPLLARLEAAPPSVMEPDRWLWYNLRQPPQVGLAAPVARLLGSLD